MCPENSRPGEGPSNPTAQHPPQDRQGQGQAGRVLAGRDKGTSDLHCQCLLEIRHCFPERGGSCQLFTLERNHFRVSYTCRRWLLIASCWRLSRFCRKSWNLSSSPRTQDQELVPRCRLPPGGHVGSGCAVPSAALAVPAAPAHLCVETREMATLPSSSSPPVASGRLKPKK